MSRTDDWIGASQILWGLWSEQWWVTNQVLLTGQRKVSQLVQTKVESWRMKMLLRYRRYASQHIMLHVGLCNCRQITVAMLSTYNGHTSIRTGFGTLLFCWENYLNIVKNQYILPWPWFSPTTVEYLSRVWGSVTLRILFGNGLWMIRKGPRRPLRYTRCTKSKLYISEI